MRKIFSVFYRFVLEKRATAVIFVISIVAAPLVESILPYFYKLFVDTIPTLDYNRLFNILLIYIGVYFLSKMLNAASYFIGDLLTFDAAINVRTAVFRHIHDLDFAFHTQKSSGSLISAIKRGDGAFWDLHHSIHYQIFSVLVNFVVMMYFFAALDMRIFALSGISFLLALIVTKLFVSANVRTRTIFNEEEDKISSVIVDNMVNFETVKIFAKEDWEAKRLAEKFRDWKSALWKFTTSFRFLDIGMSVVIVASIFAMLYLALRLTLSREFSAGDFVLIVGFTAAFYPRLFELVWGFRNIAKNYSDIERYFGLLDFDIKVKDPKNPVNKSLIKGEVHFNNISFSYDENTRYAIKKIDLKIRPGQSIALVGRSGSGKTTLVKLLMRFFDPKKGKITIDGVDIRKITKSNLRSFMGVVPQEPILFNNSIGYNISYGRPTASKREIEAASKMANIHKFIKSLPEGYETQVGERGIKLSGGQKQRVAIARMILSDPEIVIFDEATSQLDSESERLIQEAFWKAVKNKTTIIIAHRLSTVMRADKIVVMEKGKIVEFGSHNELMMKEKGLYKHFWMLQSLD